MTTREFRTCAIFWDCQEESAHTGLEVKASWINAYFKGLFATKIVEKGQTLCTYRGQQLNTVQALRTTDKSYLMRIGNQLYVDANDSPDCLAR